MIRWLPCTMGRHRLMLPASAAAAPPVSVAREAHGPCPRPHWPLRATAFTATVPPRWDRAGDRWWPALSTLLSLQPWARQDDLGSLSPQWVLECPGRQLVAALFSQLPLSLPLPTQAVPSALRRLGPATFPSTKGGERKLRARAAPWCQRTGMAA